MAVARLARASRHCAAATDRCPSFKHLCSLRSPSPVSSVRVCAAHDGVAARRWRTRATRLSFGRAARVDCGVVRRPCPLVSRSVLLPGPACAARRRSRAARRTAARGRRRLLPMAGKDGGNVLLDHRRRRAAAARHAVLHAAPARLQRGRRVDADDVRDASVERAEPRELRLNDGLVAHEGGPHELRGRGGSEGARSQWRSVSGESSARCTAQPSGCVVDVTSTRQPHLLVQELRAPKHRQLAVQQKADLDGVIEWNLLRKGVQRHTGVLQRWCGMTVAHAPPDNEFKSTEHSPKRG
jgi:hypothetical protein